MITRKIGMLALGLCLSIAVSAQKIKWETGGDLAFLKGQKEIATSYNYDKVTVKGESPEAYVAAQREELNKDKPGAGDEFADEWTKAREAKYQPGFEKLLNKKLEDDGVMVKQDAKYTIMVATGDMVLGKGKKFVKKPSLVNN